MPRHSEATKSAIKNADDIVALVGEYLPLRRVGTKYKALCPLHDDHNPSLEVNPERQSFKCWSCGVGGDVFDFVKKIERVDFPEALRMLADRAGVALESPPSAATAPRGPSKSELFEVNAWAEEVFAEALAVSETGQDYLDQRGLSRQSIERFRLGYAPTERGWLLAQARRKRFSVELLIEAGLASAVADSPGIGARAVSRSADLSDSRRSRRGRSGLAAEFCRKSNKSWPPGEACRQVPQQPRDASVSQANRALCGRPGAGGQPRGGLGGGGRGLHRRDRGSSGGALQRRRHPGDGPG